MEKHVVSRDMTFVLQRCTAVLSVVVRESCYPFLRTLLHGAFQWLQPRSPVVHEVAERGRGPDPLDARVEAERAAPARAVADARAADASARAERVRAVPANQRAGENRRVAVASRRRVAKAGAENPPQGNPARVAAPPEERAADARAADERVAGVAAVVKHSLPWLV